MRGMRDADGFLEACKTIDISGKRGEHEVFEAASRFLILCA